MSANTYHYLEECEIVAVTDNAVLVRWEDGEEWFPKTQMEEPDKWEVGDEDATVGITFWIAKKKGIEVD